MSFLAIILIVAWLAAYCVFRDWKQNGWPKPDDRGTDIAIVTTAFAGTALYIWKVFF